MAVKNFLLSVFLFLICSQVGFAQLRIDTARLYLNLRVLSADSLEGRRTGSEGSEKARLYLIKQLHKMGIAAFYPDYVQKFSYKLKGKKKEEQGVNIVAYVEGDSALAIVLSAHYDHLGMKDTLIYNGADDNASGIAALLSIAGYFAEHKPRHSIIFAFFDAEEQGLKGSKAFVNSQSFDDRNIAININLDMIGRGERELFASGTYHYPFLKKYLGLPDSNLVVSLGHDDPKFPKQDWTLSSDHGPFHQAGIPYIYFGAEDHEDYHKPSDTYEKINWAFYHAATDYVLETLISFDEDLEEIHAQRKKPEDD